MGQRNAPRCEVRNCRCSRKARRRPATVWVTEVVGDGAYRTGICKLAAADIGIRDGETLPDAGEVQKRLRAARGQR